VSLADPVGVVTALALEAIAVAPPYDLRIVTTALWIDVSMRRNFHTEKRIHGSVRGEFRVG
jgi:hypothetical protein